MDLLLSLGLLLEQTLVELVESLLVLHILAELHKRQFHHNGSPIGLSRTTVVGFAFDSEYFALGNNIMRLVFLKNDNLSILQNVNIQLWLILLENVLPQVKSPNLRKLVYFYQFFSTQVLKVVDTFKLIQFFQ